MNISDIIAIFQANIATVALCIILAQVLLLVLLFSMYRSLNLQRKKYQQLTSGQEGKNLEELLMQYATEVNITRREIRNLTKEIQEQAQRIDTSYQKLGFVRYNALPDVKGELSFSFALLDSLNSGMLISSIYGREEARVYGKQIVSGQAVTSLSREEQKVLDQAMNTCK